MSLTLSLKTFDHRYPLKMEIFAKMENVITPSSSSSSIALTHETDSRNSSIIHKLESCKSFKELKQIHSYIIKTSPTLPHQTQQLVYTTIISICASTSNHVPDITYIHSLFNKLENPTIDLYNIVIRSFSHSNENPLFALLFYSDLLAKGLIGDSFTYPYVLKSCKLSYAFREGEQIHSHVVKNGFVLNLYVVNTLMSFYGACGVMESAQKVFDESPERDLVTWTTLIQGYVKRGCLEKGMQVFYEMCEAGVIADEMTMVILISSCAKLRDINLGIKLHQYIYDNDLNFDVYICNALVDMYLKCGNPTLAINLFNKMPMKNIVSWNSIILGLIQQGKFKIAMNVFKKMQSQKVKPDNITLVGVLNCCANLGTLKQGKWVHSYINKNGIKIDGFIGNALLDMYTKCGDIKKATYVFNNMKHKDVYTYTNMILGFAIHGEGQKALKLFSEMPKIGITPNDVTYLAVLMACAHCGFVKEGLKHFVNMLKVHNIKPQKEHYGCMVDLLGRAGLLSEAEDFIRNMNIEPDGLIYGALLAACGTHKNVEIGKRVMEKVDKMMDKDKDGAFILMSNLYSSENRFRDAFKLRKIMKERKIKKSPGCSSIEVDDVAYEFRKGDKSHQQTKEIYMLLDIMGKHLKNNDQIRI
ncbi:pentatricopeptide repeat-containing protein At1g08070, chloroplastic [Lactuca sativa]|nr:pentatricopeptide repeat-containing protein At1g08070, chloroplastic [Lactuca sativa]